jgi:hypothetical protein
VYISFDPRYFVTVALVAWCIFDLEVFRPVEFVDEMFSGPPFFHRLVAQSPVLLAWSMPELRGGFTGYFIPVAASTKYSGLPLFGLFTIGSFVTESGYFPITGISTLSSVAETSYLTPPRASTSANPLTICLVDSRSVGRVY